MKKTRARTKRPSASATWLTADHKCDVCGRGPFAKPKLLLLHRLGAKCRSKVLEGVGRRTDNITRSLSTEMMPFLNFLHSTVHHQTKEVKKGPVEFIPFGKDTSLLTLDVAVMHAKTMEWSPKSESVESQLATIAASCQLWTDAWAQTLQRVPSPLTASYKTDLSTRLHATIASNTQVANLAIQGCMSKSVLLKTKVKQKRAVVRLVRGVAVVAARAGRAAELIRGGDFCAGMRAMQGPCLQSKGRNHFDHVKCTSSRDRRVQKQPHSLVVSRGSDCRIWLYISSQGNSTTLTSLKVATRPTFSSNLLSLKPAFNET